MIRFEHVSKKFPGGAEAVRDLCLEVAEGETLVLLGTSGSGKTTTMKLINRLIEPTAGRITINGSDVSELDPIVLRRKIGYAIQHIGLFPHMTVAENIGVVPRLLRWPRREVRERTDKLLGIVGLEAEQFRDRYPSQLSGGQRQRVGVARALAADPPIVLMDEPFGALDPITREQLQDEFLELETEIEKTIVFVTHDVFEAVKVADRIALLDAGRLQQVAVPSELVDSPANQFVEQFLGQHRFQLSLLTRTIGGVVEGSGAEGRERGGPLPRHHLRPRQSLIEALDLFKSTRQSRLPLVERGAVTGELERRTLIKLIAEVLEETTTES